jgi:serine/threonine protein kinase
MAPEQTGQMNRSIDARSDLYALGSHSTRCSRALGRLRRPILWSGYTAIFARKPMALSERLQTVPTVVSTLVLKLLAKIAEELCKTAAGLERDLQRCLAEWQAQRRIDVFLLGQQDTPERLLIRKAIRARARNRKDRRPVP